MGRANDAPMLKNIGRRAPCEAVTQSDGQIMVGGNGMQGPPSWCKASPLGRFSMNEHEIDRQARILYNDYSSNHPTIHCNRFPSWSELTDDQKEPWRRRVKRDI